MPGSGGFTRGGLVFGLQLVAGCVGLALVFVWGTHRGKGLIAIFRDAFASTSKIFILTGRLGTFLSRSATREATRKYHVYK